MGARRTLASQAVVCVVDGSSSIDLWKEMTTWRSEDAQEEEIAHRAACLAEILAGTSDPSAIAEQEGVSEAELVFWSDLLRRSLHYAFADPHQFHRLLQSAVVGYSAVEFSRGYLAKVETHMLSEFSGWHRDVRPLLGLLVSGGATAYGWLPVETDVDDVNLAAPDLPGGYLRHPAPQEAQRRLLAKFLSMSLDHRLVEPISSIDGQPVIPEGRVGEAISMAGGWWLVRDHQSYCTWPSLGAPVLLLQVPPRLVEVHNSLVGVLCPAFDGVSWVCLAIPTLAPLVESLYPKSPVRLPPYRPIRPRVRPPQSWK